MARQFLTSEAKVQHSLFIPADKIGSVVHAVCDLSHSDASLSKRERRREFHRAERMLQALHLLPNLAVLAISAGFRADGEEGIIVTFENAQVAGEVPHG